MAGLEAWAEQMAQGRQIPLLQDDGSSSVVVTYGLRKDDLVILDRTCRPSVIKAGSSFNLTDQEARDELTELVRNLP